MIPSLILITIYAAGCFIFATIEDRNIPNRIDKEIKQEQKAEEICR